MKEFKKHYKSVTWPKLLVLAVVSIVSMPSALLMRTNPGIHLTITSRSPEMFLPNLSYRDTRGKMKVPSEKYLEARYCEFASRSPSSPDVNLV